MAGGDNVYEVGSANQFTSVFDIMMVNGNPTSKSNFSVFLHPLIICLYF